MDVKHEKLQFLQQHQDHVTVNKLRMNRPLTPVDLEQLERMLRESGIGSADDIERAKKDSEGLGLFVRSLVGLDRGAAQEAFASFIADDAIFSPGPNTLRGKAAVLAAWSRYFEGEQAPFSWRPETVVVSAAGQLAATKGPVFDPSGKPIAEFRSTWRREPDGRWKVVFDDGTCLCKPQAAQ